MIFRFGFGFGYWDLLLLVVVVGVGVGKRRPSIRKYLDILIWIWMLGSPVAGRGCGGGGW